MTEPQLGAPRPGARSHWALPLAVALVAMLAFLPGLHGEFLDWDDRENFLHNPHYRGLGPAQLHWMVTAARTGHWIPLTWVTFGLDWQLWGMNPYGYHLTTLLLHGLAAALLYLVARRLLASARPRWPDGALTLGAVLAALLFAVHPLRAESVAWITERRDVLAGVFFLAATLVYLGRWTPDGAPRPHERLRYLVALVLFAGALGSKVMTVTLPAVLLILDVYPLRRLGPGAGGWLGRSTRRVWVEKAPFVVLGAAAAAVAVAVNRAEGNLTSMNEMGIAERLSISAYSLVFYPWKTLAPLGLSPMYELPYPLVPGDWPFLAAALAVLAITVATAALARRWPALLAAWLAYVVMALPVIGLVHNGLQIAADRYSYLPCLPWALLTGAALVMLMGPAERPRVVPAAAVGAGVLALAMMTWQQTKIWHDTETLWLRALSVAPSSVAHSNLGLTLAWRGDMKGAIPHYHEAIRLRPVFAEAWSNLALAQAEQGDVAGAESSLREAVRLKPRFATAWSNLGMMQARQGRREEAVASYREALRLQPDHPAAHLNLGATLDTQGQGEQALRHLREAVRLLPDSADAQGNLGVFYARHGDLPAAIPYFEESLRLRPASPEAHNNLGLVLAQQGRLRAAAEHFREAVRLRPGFRDAQLNLAQVESLLGGRQ